MTYQRIRIRTDIFQSQEFASLKEKTDGFPLILPTPVPSRQNDEFNHNDDDDEPEVICLGNGMDLNCDYNDNHSSKDPPYPVVEDIQGQNIEDEQSLEGVNNCIDFVDGSYSCSVCRIKLQKVSIESHLQGKRHKVKEIKMEQACKNKFRWPFTEKDLKELHSKGIDFVDGWRFSCSVCHIGLTKNDVESHLQGKQHIQLAEGLAEKAEKNKEKMLKNKLKRKQKLAAENEISSSELILTKKLKNGIFLRMCRLCDMRLKSESESRDHLRGLYHKATYEKYS